MRSFFQNQKTDFLQKSAWRIVRSAEDRFRNDKDDTAKLAWSVDRIHSQFPKEPRDILEDYIRAASINFRIETGRLNFISTP